MRRFFSVKSNYRLQFSIKAMLCFTVVAALLIVVAMKWHQGAVLRQREALRQEQADAWGTLGYTVLHDVGSSPHLVVATDLPYSGLAIRNLKLPDSIRWVIIHGGQFTDDNCVGLEALPDLEILSLKGTAISDDAMDTIKKCRKLRILNLTNTSLSDASIDSITSMDSLRDVYVDGTKISADGATKLREHLKRTKVLDQ